MALTRDQILGADDTKLDEIEIPEWGGTVFIRAMTACARDALEADFSAGRKSNFRASVAARAICDENGVLLFTEADIEKLGEKSGAALDRVFSAILAKNKITDSDVEELEGN